jgi:hypothetical protein
MEMALGEAHDQPGRLRKVFQDMPPEPEAFTFEIFSMAGTLLLSTPVLGSVLKSIGRWMGAILTALSPAMPFDVRENNSFSSDPNKFYRRILFYTVPITIFYCYVLNALLSYKSGTFWPSPDSHRLAFSVDFFNAFLYIFICPGFVSAAVCLVITVGISWKKLNNYTSAAASASIPQRPILKPETRLALFISISMLITGLYIAQYISDLADPAKTDRLYWFFDKAGSGERILNTAGGYYLVMNAILLFITSMAAFCYISISIELFRLGKYIKTSAFALKAVEPYSDAKHMLKTNERLLRASLSDFSYCYVFAKILVFFYAINIWVWQISPAGKVANVHSAIVALILIGMIFLVLPRLYLGSKWYKLKMEYAGLFDSAAVSEIEDEKPEEYEYQDVRTKNVQKLAFVLDVLFVVALAFVLYWQYGKTGILDLLLERISCALDHTKSGCSS